MNDNEIMRQRLVRQVSTEENKYNTYKLLKSDLMVLLSDYTDCRAEDVEVVVNTDKEGKYIINVRAVSRILRSAGSILID